MTWTIKIPTRVKKQIDSLPDKVRTILYTLLNEIETYGPVRGNWSNYGSLGKNRHHCHIKKGKPTYVAVWEVKDKSIKLIEVIYAGTHENAPY